MHGAHNPESITVRQPQDTFRVRVYFSCRHRARRQASPLAVLWMNAQRRSAATARNGCAAPHHDVQGDAFCNGPVARSTSRSEKETTSRRHPMNDLLFGRAVLQLLLSTLICIVFAEDRLAQGAFAYKRAQPARGRIFALKAIRWCP